MAKYKVLKRFKDKETNKIYEPGREIEMTVKRADEVTSKLGKDFLDRVDQKSAKEDE